MAGYPGAIAHRITTAGAIFIGPHATELIAAAGAALKMEATSEELARTIFAHPTLSEAMHEASESVEGKPIHI